MAAPPDPTAAFETYEARFGAKLAEAAAALRHGGEREGRIARFEATVPALSWSEILAGKVEPCRG